MPNRFFNVDPNEIVFKPGEPSDSVYRVVRGLVKVTRVLDGGKSEVRLVRPGEIFDEQALVEDRHVSDSFAVTVSDCRLEVIEIGRLRKCEGIWKQIAIQAMRRAKEAEQRARLIGDFRAGQRVAHILADLAEHCGLGGVIPLNRHELASLIGASRETTSTIVADFARQGMVEAKRGQVRVISVSRLRSL